MHPWLPDGVCGEECAEGRRFSVKHVTFNRISDWRPRDAT